MARPASVDTHDGHIETSFCDSRGNSNFARPLAYSHRTFSDVFDPEHGGLPQSHGGFVDLQVRRNGRESVSYGGPIETTLRRQGDMPEAYSVSIDPSNEEHGRRAEYHGVLPNNLGDREYDQMTISLGVVSFPQEPEYEAMLDEEGLLPSPLSGSGCSTLPGNPTSGNQMATKLRSGLQYTGSELSRLADPRSVACPSQAIESGLFVFDSSMIAMGHRQRNRKSQADKDMARHLRRTRGACLRHKINQKKCRCRTKSGTSNKHVAAGVFPQKSILLQAPEQARELAAVNHNPQANLRQEINDLEMTSAPSRRPETTIAQQLKTPVSHSNKDSHKGRLLSKGFPEGIVEQCLVFTCPFLYVGCKFVAFSSAEWSAHLDEHEKCRLALPTRPAVYPGTAFPLG